MKKDKEYDEKVIDSQKNSLPLQKESIDTSSYGKENYRRAEADAGADSAYQRHERLGLCAVAERGRPSLDNRWDTLVYEEGLPSERADDLLGNPQLALRAEADRLIAVARENGDFIPSAVWRPSVTVRTLTAGRVLSSWMRNTAASSSSRTPSPMLP